MFETVISFMSGIVVPVAIHYFQQKRLKKKEKAKDIVISHLEIQVTNQEIMDEIRNQLSADRVSIVKFSNGSDFLDNTHMLNITMIGESNSNGYDNMKHDFQKIPAYLFDRILNKLKSEDYYIEYNNLLDSKDAIVNIRRTYGIETVVGIKLYDKRGKWIGILKVGFGTNRVIDNDEIGYLTIKARQIR
jgi:hypothetical protein